MEIVNTVVYGYAGGRGSDSARFTLVAPYRIFVPQMLKPEFYVYLPYSVKTIPEE